MDFLRDTYSSRRLVGNVQTPDMAGIRDDAGASMSDHDTSDTNDVREWDSQQVGDKSDETQHEAVRAKSSLVSPKKRPRQKRDPVSDLVELEKIKVAHLQRYAQKKKKHW